MIHQVKLTIHGDSAKKRPKVTISRFTIHESVSTLPQASAGVYEGAQSPFRGDKRAERALSALPPQRTTIIYMHKESRPEAGFLDLFDFDFDFVSTKSKRSKKPEVSVSISISFLASILTSFYTVQNERIS